MSTTDPHQLMSVQRMAADAPKPWLGRIAVVLGNLRNGVTNVVAIDEDLAVVGAPSGLTMEQAREVVDEYRDEIKSWLRAPELAMELAPKLAKRLRKCLDGPVPWAEATKSHRLLRELGLAQQGDDGTTQWAVATPLGRAVGQALPP